MPNAQYGFAVNPFSSDWEDVFGPPPMGVTALSQVVATMVDSPRHSWTLIRRSPGPVDNRKQP